MTLISGPVALEPIPGIETIYIQSAQDMMDAVQARFEDNDYFILAAAISDYRPKETAPQKMKNKEIRWRSNSLKIPISSLG